MSKTKLKKELSSFTQDQLIEVVLQVYDVSKEAKDYLEYFLSPDQEQFYTKTLDAIDAEFNRIRRRVAKFRISLIKKYIKTAQGYGLDVEYVANLKYHSICRIALLLKYYYLTDTQCRAYETLISDYIEFCLKEGIVDVALRKMAELCSAKNISKSVRSSTETIVNQIISLLALKSRSIHD